MLRVTDLDASIKYYTEALGMQLLRKSDNEQYKYTLAFVGYGPEQDNLVIELTHNWGDNSYTKGDAYAQVAIQTTDGAPPGTLPGLARCILLMCTGLSLLLRQRLGPGGPGSQAVWVRRGA